MIKIIVCGDCGSRAVTKSILRVCKAYGGALVCDSGQIYETESNPKFLLISANALTDICCEKAIVVLGKALCQIQPDMNIGNTSVVVDTGNQDGIHLLSGKKVSVIGCSMSGHDTLNASGINSFPNKMVSLQRNIQTVSGEIIEPHEFKVTLKEELTLYPLLSACAVLLLSGENSDSGYVF